MDELDFANFRHGGANLTGFRLIDPERPRTKDAAQAWARLSPSSWRGAGRRLQLDAALTMDGVTAIVQGLSSLISHADSTLFRETFRRGQVYNNGTRGIQCKPDSPVWVHGRAIMNSFEQVPVQPTLTAFVFTYSRVLWSRRRTPEHIVRVSQSIKRSFRWPK